MSAVSYAGDTHQENDEFFFADTVTNVYEDMCNTSFQQSVCKGRKHIFSVSTCTESAGMLCRYLSNLLLKRTNEKIRIKVQFSLKNAVDEITKVYTDNQKTDMSMLYIDGENVYAAGYGDINIYHFDKTKGIVTPVDFPLSPLTDSGTSDDLLGVKDDRLTHARYLTGVIEGDEYLVAGKALKDIVGDDDICSILSSNSGNCVQILSDLAREKDASKTISLIHIAVKKSKSLLYGLIFGSAILLALLLIILL